MLHNNLMNEIPQRSLISSTVRLGNDGYNCSALILTGQAMASETISPYLIRH